MLITITLYCHDWQSTKVLKNGKKSYGKQNYLCKDCLHQFIGDHNLTYKDCLSMIYQKILILLVRGVGVRDIAKIEQVSIKKVLLVLVGFNR